MPTEPHLIAVVDDEQSVRKALERLMRSAGFSVKVFASGAEFLRSLQERQPDCVVLDLHMPDADGFEVLDALERGGIHLRVVVITADDSPQNRARALSHGAHNYLRKPVDEAMLLDAVHTAIRH
jgi:FixJ family two-component response regulator